MTVREIVREKVATVAPDESVAAVVGTMTEFGVGSVVVTEGDDPVGIITDRDLVLRVYGAGHDPDTVTAREVMSADLVMVGDDEGVYELVKVMAEHGVRRVPVVENGTLAGIVTLDDVIILLSMELQRIETLIRAESPPFEVPAERLVDE